MKRYAEAPGAGPATSPWADMKWLPGLEGSERQAALEHNAQIAARTTPPWANRTCAPRPSGGQSKIIRRQRPCMRGGGQEVSETSSSEASSSTRVVPSAKAAPTLAELDEWENRPTEEKRRLMQEARRVMEGNRASASAVADAIVYIPATGARFHSRPRCGNMATPREVTRASAETMGYTRCGNCWQHRVR